MPNDRVIGDGEVHRIGESNRSSALSFRTMATGAVLRIEDVEIRNFLRIDWNSIVEAWSIRYCIRTKQDAERLAIPKSHAGASC